MCCHGDFLFRQDFSVVVGRRVGNFKAKSRILGRNRGIFCNRAKSGRNSANYPAKLSVYLQNKNFYNDSNNKNIDII